MKATTAAVKGIQVEVRGELFSYRATVQHLGGGGTTYEKFSGRWMPVFFDSVPTGVYRKLRAGVRSAVKVALNKA